MALEATFLKNIFRVSVLLVLVFLLRSESIASAQASNPLMPPSWQTEIAAIPPDVRVPTFQEQASYAELQRNTYEATRSGEIETIEKNFRSMIDMMEETFGEDHPQTASSKVSTALELLKYNLFSEAQSLASEARQSTEDRLGNTHELFLLARATEAQTLAALGDWQRADDIFEELLEQLETPKAASYDFRTRLQVRTMYATTLIAGSRHDKGRALMLELLAENEARYSKTSPVLLSVLEPLVRSYFFTANYAEAIPLLERVIAMLDSTSGSQTPQALHAKGMLAAALMRSPNIEKRERAIQLSKQVAKHADTAGLPPLVVGRYKIEYANHAKNFGDTSAAVEYFGSGLNDLRDSPSADAFEIFLAETGYALSLQFNGQETEAGKVLETAHSELVSLHPDAHPLTVQSHIRLANYYHNMNDLASTMRHVETGLKLLESDRSGKLVSLKPDLLLARVSANSDNVPAQIEDLEEVRALLREASNPVTLGNRIWATQLLAAAYIELGQTDKGRTLVEETQTLMPPDDSRQSFGFTLLALVAITEGDQELARKYSQKRFDLEHSVRVKGGNANGTDALFATDQVQFLINQANMLSHTGETGSALGVLSEALTIADRHQPSLRMQRLGILSGFAQAHFLAGNVHKGREYTQQLFAEHSGDDVPSDPLWLAAGGIQASMHGQIDLLVEMFAIHTDHYPEPSGGNGSDAIFLILEALLSIANEDYVAASEAMQLIPDDHPLKSQLGPIKQVINAASLSMSGEHAEAYALLKKDFDLNQGVTSSNLIQDDWESRKMLRDQMSAISPIIMGSGYELFSESAQDQRLNYIREAVAMAQVSGLKDASAAFELGLLKTTAEARNLRSDYNKLADAERQLNRLDVDIVRYMGDPEKQAVVEDLNIQRKELTEDYQQASASIDKAMPLLADMIRGEPVSLDELQGELLRPDEALIVINATAIGDVQGDRSFEPHPVSRDHIIVVTRESAAWVRVDMPLDELLDHTFNLHSAFENSANQLRSGSIVNKNEQTEFPVDSAAHLYRALFDHPSVKEILSEKSDWTIVPSEIYASIPYAALVSTPGEEAFITISSASDLRRLEWLGLKKNIALAPSIVSLKYARERPQAERSRQASPFFGIGAPLFKGAADGDVSALGSYQRSGIGDISAIRNLPPLPHTALEIRTLAKELGATSGSFLLHDEATEAELRRVNKTGELARARVIAFATHGLIAGEGELSINEPALALTPPIQADGAQIDPNNDGLLTASEAAELDLLAEWVILSACNTASSNRSGGEELSGLASGFLASGAQSLLVSHYPVYDDAAATLTTRAVAYAEAPGISRAEALRKSMYELMSDTSRDDSGLSTAHPAVWAPFALIDPY